MAWLERDVRTGNYKVGFRVGNRKVKKSVQTSSRIEANELLGVVEQTLKAVERGWTTVPPGVDLGDFLLSGGRLAGPLQLADKLVLSDLFQAYFASLPEGNLEPSTISGMRQHERQLYRILGKSFDVRLLTTADLQRYIEKRSTEPGIRGRKVTPNTIKKAIVTLRTVWNWGVTTGRLEKRFPNRGLKYPKAIEKPPFQTWKEIEQQIARGGLSDAEVADLWDCLFLTLPEIDSLLRYVHTTARQPWVYPAVCMAAHTGARRSEIFRSRVNDLDFKSRTITIHERKRNHERATLRRVPMSPFLAGALKSWMKKHPGGLHTFCQTPDVLFSNKKRLEPEAVTWDEASDHFWRTMQGSKWSVVRGWHVFRHSFCSNCAANGIDQRLINAWVGHQTEDMVRRYRHLIPDQQQSAIRSVFG